ncbi:MAG: ChbG/HpnK family deacetylase [Caldilineaceae bacterium]
MTAPNLVPNPVLRKLGYADDARLVMFHIDDVGMCHGANVAFETLAISGAVSCGSVMMPCPWSLEMLQIARANPALDLGVHLTLNSEFVTGYRWGPLSTRDPASGLLDETGWFWPRPEHLHKQIVVPAAEVELRAQVEAAACAGLDFTHLDAHMGAALWGTLLRFYIELGFAFKVPVLLPRGQDAYSRSLNVTTLEPDAWNELVAEVEARGMPLVDAFRITPGYDASGEGGRADLYEQTLRDLPPGITFFSLHANAPGDIEVINPPRAHWRTFEYSWFQQPRLRALLAEEKIVPIGYRALRDLMRRELGAGSPA